MLVAGARPNFMKIAPLYRAFKASGGFDITLIHTGQHYDNAMSRVFFEDLKIPKPDLNLGVGSGSHTAQTADTMKAFDAVIERNMPDLVVVVGDVNSTLACSLAAKKRGIKVAHVEAGLRSFDWSMPEEINRIVTDRISDFLFVSEPSGLKNLKAEGTDPKKIFFVGNVMIDTLLAHKKKADRSKILSSLGLEGKQFAVVTLHRPNNVDTKGHLAHLLALLAKIAAKGITILFPMHPRTAKNIKHWQLKTPGLLVTEPLGYLDFLKAMNHASFVLTDSGGIQEETTILGIPCLTVRPNTERPATVTSGTNLVTGMDSAKILRAVDQILKHGISKKPPPKFWDGRASQRIAKILKSHL